MIRIRLLAVYLWVKLVSISKATIIIDYFPFRFKSALNIILIIILLGVSFTLWSRLFTNLIFLNILCIVINWLFLRFWLFTLLQRIRLLSSILLLNILILKCISFHNLVKSVNSIIIFLKSIDLFLHQRPFFFYLIYFHSKHFVFLSKFWCFVPVLLNIVFLILEISLERWALAIEEIKFIPVRNIVLL